ncbi:MAG: PTS sugar transporter subunit IIA [Planctomycetota bacterium]|jgi:PTS system fructose-specific IIA component/PTS system nitrogen regulatory IIA component
MRLSQVIAPGAVTFPLEARSVDQALGELVRSMVSAGRLAPELEDPALLSLMKREAVGPTGLGRGVAVPHARLPRLDDICGALGVSPGGIPFGSAPPVHVVFLFLAPVWDHEGYLALLAMVSRIVRSGDFVNAVRRADDVDGVARALKQFEAGLSPHHGPEE